MMREQPILFSAPMVRAILEGRKTMTRRVVKCIHELTAPSDNAEFRGRSPYPLAEDKSGATFYFRTPETIIGMNCPYGIPGDRLWVRETWHCDSPAAAQDVMSRGEGLYYRATEPCPEIFPKWRPSIFMPRWASRITLEIVSVRVERLQEISHEDAIKEGIETWVESLEDKSSELREERLSLKQLAFSRLWDSINGKKCPWSSNPWVWVIEFKRLTP